MLVSVLVLVLLMVLCARASRVFFVSGSRLVVLVQVGAARVRQAARGAAQQGAAERRHLRLARDLRVLPHTGAGELSYFTVAARNSRSVRQSGRHA